MSFWQQHSPVKHRRFAKLLLLLGAVAVALLLAEIGLRVVGYRHFNPSIVDRDVGYSLRPNAEGWWRKEGLAYVKINSQGLRDREHSITKPPKTIRIAVLGDSFAEALQVPMENTFWALMERQLQNCVAPGTKVEVINFGVSGFSTARELIFLRQRVWQYSPDVVLLLVTSSNDIRDNSPALDQYSGTPLPYFVLRGDSLTLDDSRLQARNSSLTFRLQQSVIGESLNWLREHSRLIGLIDNAREVYQARQIQQTGLRDGPQGEPGLNAEVLREPRDSKWQDAWRVTERLLVEMRDEVKAKGAKFFVVTGSTGIQVSPDALNRDVYMKRLGVDSLFYPEQRIKALGDREGFAVLNLAPPLLDYATREHVFVHGFGTTLGSGHWNENGHRVVGGLIANELCAPVRALETH
jgi:hypothetical protein